MRAHLACCTSRVVLALAVSVAVAGCRSKPSGSETTSANVKPPVSAAVVNAKAVFIGNVASSEEGEPAAPVTPTPSQLIRVNPDGTVEVVPFQDEEGNPVAVVIDHVEVLSPEYLAVDLRYDLIYASDRLVASRSLSVLARLSDGKLSDITPLNFDVRVVEVKGDHLYGIDENWGTLYRITLSTMQAQPMNNRLYDDASRRYRRNFEVDRRGNVRLPLVPPGGGSWGPKIFFDDNSPPAPDSWTHDWDSSTAYCPPGGPNVQLADVYGANGDLMVVCMSFAPDPDVTPNGYRMSYFARTLAFTETGTQFTDGAPLRTAACPNYSAASCPESVLAVASQYRRRTMSRYLPVTSGFFTMSPDPTNGVALSWTDLPLPAITLVAGEYGYWKSGDSISRIHFAPGATPELLVTAPHVIGWNVAGGVLIYTAYITGTNVGTYRVVPGQAPVLVQSSDMLVQQIVELQ